MFIEFIPLSLAYNVYAFKISKFGSCIPDMHICICKLSIRHPVLTWEFWMIDRFDIIIFLYTHASMCVKWKCIVLGPCHTHVLSTLNWVLPWEWLFIIWHELLIGIYMWKCYSYVWTYTVSWMLVLNRSNYVTDKLATVH